MHLQGRSVFFFRGIIEYVKVDEDTFSPGYKMCSKQNGNTLGESHNKIPTKKLPKQKSQTSRPDGYRDLVFVTFKQ
jgi:hypothetical protein